MRMSLGLSSVKTIAFLLIAICVLIAVAITIGSTIVLHRTHDIDTEWKVIGERLIPKTEALNRIRGAIGYGGMIHEYKNYVLRGDSVRINKFFRQTEIAKKAVESYRVLGVDSEESVALQHISSVINIYEKNIEKAKTLVEEGQTPEQIDASVKVSDKSALEALSVLDIKGTQLFSDKTMVFNTRLGEINQLLVLSTVLAPILLLILAGLLSYGVKSLLKLLGAEPQEVMALSSQVAAGDLALSPVYKSRELTGIMGSLVCTVTALTNVINKIETASYSVSRQAQMIAQKSQDLNERTMNQTAGLEETAASMEEMTATVKDNMTNTQRANDLASGARRRAKSGEEVVSRVIDAMGGINTSSKKIADIIGVINDIAFQTNLLALNAAVEAAQAGEKGRGFAVVATEVRNLAQRSALAAKEIESLIEESVSKVNEGSELVSDAARTINGIIKSVEEVSDTVSSIAGANQEQFSGIVEVNAAVTQMDNIAQRYASSVEDTSMASVSMREQAEALRDAIKFFKMPGEKAFDRPEAPTVPHPSEAVVDQQWHGEERRMQDRPWKMGQPSLTAVTVASQKNIDDDDDWEVF